MAGQVVAPEKTGMAAYRHAMDQRGGNWLAIGIGAVVAALLLVIVLAERGTFRLRDGAVASALPGVTLDNSDDHLPVVTSVRSDGEAERVGIRAGDEIEAVDGHPVRDVAGLRSALLSDRDDKLALHIRRGDTLWTVALDRSEPAIGNAVAVENKNGPENPAD